MGIKGEFYKSCGFRRTTFKSIVYLNRGTGWIFKGLSYRLTEWVLSPRRSPVSLWGQLTVESKSIATDTTVELYSFHNWS